MVIVEPQLENRYSYSNYYYLTKRGRKTWTVITNMGKCLETMTP